MRFNVPSVLSSLTYFNAVSPGVNPVLSTGTTIEQVNLGLCVPGQVLWITAQMTMLKGATSGGSSMFVDKGSGSATVDFGTAFPQIFQETKTHLNATAWYNTLAGFARITGAGDLVLRLRAVSVGSDGQVLANQANIAVIRINR